jgi:CubicO group peptidase (beta-lactamase class C family)
MKMIRSFRVGAVFAALAVLSQISKAQTAPMLNAPAKVAHGLDMTPVKPESVGFSSARLERLHAAMQAEVDKKQISGYVTILARHGKVVDYRVGGVRDMASGAPMTKDAIFRDYSMTKPVTGVAMMILYEQGKWLPSDPIAKYVPEFAHLKVFKGMDADSKPILVDPDHAPTMRELMSHTAGFIYGFGNSPVDKMYQDANLFGSSNLEEFVGKLAKLPLSYQPGTKWIYSVSMDIEGYIVEKLSGQSLPDFMRDNIYKPLGMRDAGFFVPAEKRSRLVTNYRGDEKGNLTVVPANGLLGMNFMAEPTMPSGGGGMVSTAEDYYRFAQMLGNGGELDGKRVLSPSTVKLMTSNHVPVSLLTGEFAGGMHVMRPGFGYGINGAVVFDPPEANLTDGKGTYLWDGAAGTWFWVDPTNDIVFVAMIQRMGSPDNHVLEYRSHAVVYGALVDLAK